MNNLRIPLIAICLLAGCKTAQISKRLIETNGNNFWTTQKSEEYLLNRQDSTKWDLEMLSNDLENIIPNSSLPFMQSAFPTPNYDLIGKGSFTGLGVFAYPGGEDLELKISEKTILFNSFIAKKSIVNEKFIGEKKDEVFFQIILLTDNIDTVNYSHLSSQIVSRNHPHYIGQGYYKTKTNKIDYAAFLTADRNEYAIINMRLFDLRQGRTILVAPQKDNSLRTFQIKSHLLSSEKVEEFTKNLMKQKDVISFFTFKGNI